MKRALLAATAAALMAGAATAADLPRGPAPYYSNTPAPAAGFSWAGWYAGANVGYEWGTVPGSSANPKGAAGGLQGGYNWQWGQWVLGAETDLQASGADDSFGAWKFSNRWFGTLRGRAGYAMNNILFYGTFGLAYGDVKAELAGASESHAMAGLAAGAGMEVGLTPNWSAKVEYLYMDLGNRTFAITGNDLGLHANYLRFGVNYHF
jgi:outer membrane immunogenic protein